MNLFFSQEWSRLRSLIMSMEEESWSDAAPSSETKGPAMSVGCTSNTESVGNALLNQNGERLVDQPEANTADRLTLLERRIEQRLRIAIAERR